MSSEYVKIEVYINDINAEIAKGLLAENGIRSRIFKDDCGGLEPQLQLTQGVHLSVPFGDVENAKKLLKPHQESQQNGQEDSGPVQTWKCGKCGEQLEIQFTSCWSCGSDRN
ncbi:DUF2007 domain-containing protein [bacterium]|nr:DUF2007 domain-containing protein [bacterium]